jgi:hypothetical protein
MKTIEAEVTPRLPVRHADHRLLWKVRRSTRQVRSRRRSIGLRYGRRFRHRGAAALPSALSAADASSDGEDPPPGRDFRE